MLTIENKESHATDVTFEGLLKNTMFTLVNGSYRFLELNLLMKSWHKEYLYNNL